MLLSIRSLNKTFPGTRALDSVDFDLQAGEVHALLGENGAGKSTLIKCLTGAYRRDGGVITLDGSEIDPQSTVQAQDLGIGTVYQEVNLLPNLTVAQNLMFGREPRRFGLIDNRAMRAQARQMLQAYGLDLDVDRNLGSYSVAIQQIIAIARAVALSGKVLILDEPTASLDAQEVQLVFDVGARAARTWSGHHLRVAFSGSGIRPDRPCDGPAKRPQDRDRKHPRSEPGQSDRPYAGP